METIITPLDQALQQAEAKIAELTTELEREREAGIRRADILSKASSDFAIISDILIDEANSRGYCEAYDSIIESINGQLSFGQLKPRTRTFKIQANITGSVTTEVEVEVEATSEEDANERFTEDPYKYLDVDEALMDEARIGFDDVEVNLY